MKTLITLIVFLVCSFFCNAQVQCVQCYNQNNRVITDTNNLIRNGGFEISTCTIYDNTHSFCPASTYYTCDIANWICSGGGIATYAHICDTSYSIIVEGIRAVYFGNGLAVNSCSTVNSDTSCMSHSGCEVTGIPAGYPVNIHWQFGGDTGVSLQQTVNGLTIGTIYILEFWAGGEGWNGKEGLFAVDIGFGKIFMRDPGTSNIAAIGTRYVIAFTASSTSHTINFTNWGHIIGCPELILDDVRLFAWNGEGSLCATGVNEVNKNNEIVVFPNPATYQFTVTTNVNEQSEIILYDIASRKLLNRSFVNTTTINTERLAHGVYFYEVTDKQGITGRGKLVKE